MIAARIPKVMLDAREIALALGGHRSGRGYAARCPAHDDRKPSLSLRDAEGKVLVRCHAGCPQTAVIDALRSRGLWSDSPINGRVAPHPPPSVRGDDESCRVESALRLWHEAEDPRGTRVEHYFKHNELVLDDSLAVHVLRFHRRCPFGKDEAGETLFMPCIVALFRDIHTDQPKGIHRLALTDNDRNSVDKKMLGRCGGCGVKLDDDAEVTYGFNVTEGIGTALSVRAAGIRPIWALGSAKAVGTFPVLNGIDALTIYANNDKSGTGENVASICERRWHAAGREARVRMPHKQDCDWQDEWGAR